MNSSELESELNDTLRKIGRNVLHFQRMEAMLKFMISHSGIQGTVSTLKAKREKAVEVVSRQTMGNLVKEFFTTIYSEEVNSDESAEDIEEIWVKFSFKLEANKDYIEQRKSALERIVEERNILIHQMLSRLDQQSLQSCRELGVLLDEQAERIRPEYEVLRSLVMSLQTGRKDALEALSKEIGTESDN